MKFNRLGRTDIKVSEICLGTMTWGEQNTEAEGHEQIDYALDQGINFIDTAEMYSIPVREETYGATEEIIGTWLKKSGKRNDIILASKIAGSGREWVRGGGPITGEGIRLAVDASLKRLQTDYIDLYQLHWPNRGHYHFENSWSFDPSVQNKDDVIPNMVEVLEALNTCVEQGKIRHVGLSNESAWGTMQYLRLAEQMNLPRPVSIQNEYNFLRRYYDMDLAELAHHEDVGLLAYSPLASGAIAGKYLDGALPKGTRGWLAGSAYRSNELTDPAIRAYMELAEAHNLDVCQMAIAFCLTKPFMTSVIIGATKMEQLKSDIAAADLTLSSDVLDGIRDVFRKHPRTL